MNDDSDNLQPGFYGPQFPIYPEVAQLVLVTGPAISGFSPSILPCATASPGVPPSLYPCVIVQIDPTLLQVRSRVTAYVMEPNGVTLTAAVYDARLIGSFNGLPLFATTCCLLPGSSSSSSSSRSSH